MSGASVLSGRSFATRFDVSGDAVWQPLEAVARVARSSAHLAPFHEGEFMFMGTVSNAYKRLDVHLYKHVDTRRYLNLDDADHAYAYLGPASPAVDTTTGGRYRRFRSLSRCHRSCGVLGIRRRALPLSELSAGGMAAGRAS